MTTGPVEELEHDGETFRIQYKQVIECEHCGHTWGTTSGARRPTCTGCQRKTDRNEKGRYYDTYLKHTLFSGEESSIDEVSGKLRQYAKLFEAMEANGWEFDCTTQSSHVALHKGDVEPQKIVA